MLNFNVYLYISKAFQHYVQVCYCTVFIVLALFTVNPQLLSQPYYFRHYQVENGLSNNTVFCSIQDKQGFLWFGTKEGLNRYDGYQFKHFKLDKENERTLTPDLIFCLYNDVHDTLWVGGEKGLYKYVPTQEKLIRMFDSLPNVSGIQMDKEGQLWFLSSGNVYRFDLKNNRLKGFPANDYFPATSICMTPSGSIWFSDVNGYIYDYDFSGQRFNRHDIFQHSIPPSSRWVQKVSPGKGETLYIGTASQGLKQFSIPDNDYKDILTYNPDKTTVFVRDILQKNTDEFWFATESGIFILNNDGSFTNLKKKILDPYSLSDNAVYSLCKDSEGGVWAGTFFGGLNYFASRNGVFQKYFPDNTGDAISGNAVREICEDSLGNLWIGTEDAGLNKLNKKTGAITHFEPTGEPGSIAYYNIHGLMVDGDRLWIGTFEHGLDIMDINTGKIIKRYKAGPLASELKSNFPLCFLKATSGEIYTGTSNGFFHYKKTSDDFERSAEIADAIFIASIIEDYRHNIWVGTRYGVVWFNPVTHERGHFINEPDNKNSLPNNNVNALFEDSKHNIWVCTEGGGLCSIDSSRKVFTRYTTKNGLPSNFIFKVLEDNNKQLWVTTSKGLVNFHPNVHSTTVYTKANGLLNDQFNYHSGYKDAEGNLYFGSVRGMISFNPSDFKRNNFVPPVYITGFQVNNEELETTQDSAALKQSIVFAKDITLPYDRASFSLNFAALSYTSPGMTEYKYLMDGLDKEWTELRTNRKVYFTSLAPGNYTFRLKASINGHWDSREQTLAIHILPPFWKTSWAYLIYTITIAILAWYLIRSYHASIETKKEKEIYEAKIDFFTNVAHEIRTPLTLIKGPVENLMEQVDDMPSIKEDVVTMERNTNRLIALVTQILDFRKTETKGFSLDFTEVNIGSLLQETFLDFTTLAKKRKLSYQLYLPHTPIHAWVDEEALHKIFSNLLSNAVKYGAQQAHVTLHELQKGDSHFIVKVTNDGHIIPEEMQEKIFEPFYRLKETTKQKGTGIGLTLSRSLAELHNGTLTLEDSKNGLNCFVLCVPLKPGKNVLEKQQPGTGLVTIK